MFFSTSKDEVEYSQLEPLFSGVQFVDKGTAYGFRFSTSADEETFQNHINQLVSGGGSPDINSLPQPVIDEEVPAVPPPEKKPKPFLYCLNFLNNLKDDTVRRGSVVRTLAVCTRHNYIHIYKPFMMLALQRYYANPSEEVLAELYTALNAMDTSQMPSLDDNRKLILRATTDRTKHTFSTSIPYLGKTMHVQVPRTLFADEVGDVCTTSSQQVSKLPKIRPTETRMHIRLLSKGGNTSA